MLLFSCGKICPTKSSKDSGATQVEFSERVGPEATTETETERGHRLPP